MSKVLVIGDVIEDVIVIPESAIRENTDTKSAIHKSMGGQAANVASWLSHLGTEATFVGCVGAPDVKKLESELSERGIQTALQSSSKPTGSLVVLVQGATRSMLTDRGANLDLNLGDIDPTGFLAVYLSGYSLLGRSVDEIKELAQRVMRAGALLAIDPGSYGFIQDHGVEKFRELLSLADLVFPNLEEEHFLKLRGQVPLTIITRGQAGAMAAWADGEMLEIVGEAAESVDPTGAGDAFCAGFLGRLIQEPNFRTLEKKAVQSALETGIQAGSQAVRLVGARPPLKS
jgi:sugar/nucleoside kinase (ribokinase family)